MASSDEEDLEALRLAALASIKSKPAAEEPPQGIQVVRSVTSLQSSPSQEFLPLQSSASQEFLPQTTGHIVQAFIPHPHQNLHLQPHPLTQPVPYPQPNLQPHLHLQPQPHLQLQHHPQPHLQPHPQPHLQPHPQQEEQQFVSEFGEVPVEFQQAVLQHQNWSRGGPYGRRNFRGQRGFPRGLPPRGRGRGRARGFNNFQPQQPPPPQNALIVIQVEGSGNNGEPVREERKESRPVLLRPQDKWMSSDYSQQAVSPTRTKDKSKFGRYDADSDSEEEDEAAEEEEENQENFDEPETTDYLEPAEQSDQESGVGSGSEAPSETEDKADESDSDSYSEFIMETGEGKTTDNCDVKSTEKKDDDLNKTESDLNELKKVDQSLVSISDVSLSDIDKPNDVSVDLKGPEEKTVETVDEKHLHDGNCDMNKSIEAHNGAEGAATAEKSSLLNVIRNEDSVSNSYSTFSRFNRRNRRNSDSGDDSESDSSDNSDNDRNKATSTSAKFVVGSSSESEVESETELVDLQSSPELFAAKSPRASSPVEESVTVPQSNKPASKPPSSASNSPSHKSRSASSSSSASGSSSSSGSGSASDTSSGSDSSSRESSPAPSVSPAKHSTSSTTVDRKRAKSEKDTKNTSSKADSPKSSRRDSYPRSSRSPKSSRHSQPKDFSDRRKRSPPSQKTSPERTRASRQHRRYSPVQRRVELEPREVPKRPETKRDSRYTSDKHSHDVVADPEFDAANYRDENMYNRNRPRENQHRDRLRIDSKDKSGERKPDRRDAGLSQENRDKETRYFKDVTKLKDDKRFLKYSTDVHNNSTEHVPKVKHVDENKKSNRRLDEKVSKGQRTDKRGQSSSVKDTLSNSRKTDYKRHSSRSVTPEKSRKSRFKSSISPVNDRRKHSESVKSKKDDKISSKDTKLSKSKDSELVKKADKHERRRKSDEKGSRRKSSETTNDKRVEETDDNFRRKNIQDKLKKMAGVNFDSGGSDSEDSEKSVSSLSDISSESESATWRNKKSGASRDTDDIERERRRRRLLEREKRRDSEKGRNERRRDGGELRDSFRDKRRGDWGTTGRSRERADFTDDRRHSGQSGVKERYHHSKKMVFYEEKLDAKKKAFEEWSSDSDSKDTVQRGLITVVPNQKAKKSSTDIPSLMDIKISRPAKEVGSSKKRPKKERLVIQVAQSSDDGEEIEEPAKKKKHKKRSKVKRSQTSDADSDQEEDEWARKQTVNVTFDKKEIKSSKPSVYERLGMAVSKKDKPRSERAQPSQEVVVPSGGKRIKLNEKGKYQSSKHTTEEGDDSALNKRIQKIQAKNAEILRRKKEVEFDKQKYG